MLLNLLPAILLGLVSNQVTAEHDVSALSSAFSALKLAAIEGHATIAEQILSENSSVGFEQDSLGLTPLHWAAMGGHADVVQILLRFDHLDIDTRDVEGYTALHWSTNPEVSKLLVISGAEVDAVGRDGATPLHRAVDSGDFALVKTLLRFGVSVSVTDNGGRTPLDLAVLKKYRPIIMLLRSCGAKNSLYTLDGYLVTTTVPTTLPTSTPPSVLMRMKTTRTPEIRTLFEEVKMQIAARDGLDEDLVNLCKERVNMSVADPSGAHLTPLHQAAASGHHLLSLTLLQCGANINAVNSAGNTPLHLAIVGEHYQVADVLVVSGADTQIRNRAGKSPYDLAQQASNENFRRTFNKMVLEWCSSVRKLSRTEQQLHEIVTKGWYIGVAKLCKSGVDVQVKDEDNNDNTALHLAASTNITNTVGSIVVLVKCGANVNAKNKDGNTPLHLAVIEGFMDAAMALLLSKADPFVPNNAGKTPKQLWSQRTLI